MERYRFIVFSLSIYSSDIIEHDQLQRLSYYIVVHVSMCSSIICSISSNASPPACFRSFYLSPFLSLSSTTTGAFGRLCTTQPPPHPPPLSIAHLIYSPASSTVADISNCPLYTLVYLSFSVYVRFADGCEKRSTNHDER
jgi:hypothetical protein